MTSQELLQRAMKLHQAGRFAEAEPLYAQALERTPGNYPALHLLGLMRLQQGRLPEALALMERALKAEPGQPDTMANYAIALSGLGRHEDALTAMDNVVAARPGDSRAFSNRGGIKSKLKRSEEALADFDRALALDKSNADALNNRGLMLHQLRRYDEALGAFDALMALAPDYAEGRNNRGLTLRELGRPKEALAEFDRVLSAQPGHAGVWANRATALWRLDRTDEALESYAKALALDPNLLAALESRANLLWTRNRALAPAIADLERALKVSPGRAFVFGDLMHLKLHAADWRDFAAARARLDEGVRAGKPVVKPFIYQGLSESPADMLACAEIYVEAYCRALPPVARLASRRPGRIRIGYVSGEFRAQATMYLMAGLFESHDRARFEIFAFDNGRDDGSPMRQRVMAAFDKFIPIALLSDRDAAAAVAAQDVDILVNLNGYFGEMRMNLFAHRAAPVQVNYLGFPGTLGADYMDYILADAVLIPESEYRFYREKVVTLPGSYQINDSKRAPVESATRAAHGLPQDAFVFCHFNAGYKITPELFACWMRILRQTENSLLWLLGGEKLFQDNLAVEAAKAGIDPARLAFAPQLPLNAHLARLALGDLFLDSVVSNAHTTASDALWAGLPLLTARGHTFQGRVAASLLGAVGLPELVVENMEEYESLALRLARDPELLKSYRARLAQNRPGAPLFDTARTTRYIEAAYERMQALRLNGEAPRSFAVSSS
jgi:predicted O-linked N-acetylglucosamine transferase (SPINDLY family)